MQLAQIITVILATALYWAVKSAAAACVLDHVSLLDLDYWELSGQKLDSSI